MATKPPRPRPMHSGSWRRGQRSRATRWKKITNPGALLTRLRALLGPCIDVFAPLSPLRFSLLRCFFAAPLSLCRAPSPRSILFTPWRPRSLPPARRPQARSLAPPLINAAQNKCDEVQRVTFPPPLHCPAPSFLSSSSHFFLFLN